MRSVLTRPRFLYSHRTMSGRRVALPYLLWLGFKVRMRLPEFRWLEFVLDRLLSSESPGVLDVGANMGQTLISLYAVRPGASYLGFEPNPLGAAYIRALIEENRFANATVVPAALSDRTGVGALYFHREDGLDSGATTLRELRPNRRQAPMPINPLRLR